jgi:hypothetical protein
MVTAAISAKQQFLSEETNGNNNNSSRKEEKLLTLANLVGVYHGKVWGTDAGRVSHLTNIPWGYSAPVKHKVLEELSGIEVDWITGSAKGPEKAPENWQQESTSRVSLQVEGVQQKYMASHVMLLSNGLRPALPGMGCITLLP